MKPLLLTSYGSCLKVRAGKLVLFDQGTREQQEWAPADFPYDAVVCDPLGGFVTFPALRWIAERGAVLSLLNFNGTPMLTAVPDHPINGRDRLHQMAAHLDPQKRLEIAKEVVSAKTGRAVPTYVRTLNQLLMWEAEQAVGYWKALGVVRDYPHARDPRNLAINYCFGLLESAVRRVVHRLGLEPSVGFLHQPKAPFENKSAFVYDAMEPFRDAAVRVALAEPFKRDDYYPVFGHGLKVREKAAKRLAERFSRQVSEREIAEWLRRLSLQMALQPTQDRPGPLPSPQAAAEAAC
jgi:CRISPR/Cas system-associated endonuclease Cas1